MCTKNGVIEKLQISPECVAAGASHNLTSAIILYPVYSALRNSFPKRLHQLRWRSPANCRNIVCGLFNLIVYVELGLIL